jgi:hypothetical protein
MFEIVMDNTYILLQRKADFLRFKFQEMNQKGQVSTLVLKRKFSIFQFHTFTDRAVK